MKKYHIFVCLFSLWIFTSVHGQPTSKKIDVLIVDGFSNHDWEQTTFVVKTILEKSELFNVSVSTSPAEPEDKNWKHWKPKFKKFDVVIINCNNINNKEIKWPKKIEKHLEHYVSTGGGLYILHSANNAFPHWKGYNLMIGLGWRQPNQGIALQVTNDEKIKEIPLGEGKATYHGPRNDVIIYKLNNHLINRDLPKKWKTPDMELYKYARGPAKNLTVLSYAKDDITNINWPVEWVVSYGNGRVYNSSMGHLWKGQTYPMSYRCIGFQTILIRATEWLASESVTYKIPENFPTEFNISLVNEQISKK
ncbi:ThuA domain-containing protein [Seonamhaeicola maritimus]|uniref:ThuA domain-containing protein n=1 Tax=Seonamhaeicola maritimus TaxID=2591822 RepID=UPI0024953776|nr:ThuA domain-containing protein [Seonamhaeicola maritimus]